MPARTRRFKERRSARGSRSFTSSTFVSTRPGNSRIGGSRRISTSSTRTITPRVTPSHTTTTSRDSRPKPDCPSSRASGYAGNSEMTRVASFALSLLALSGALGCAPELDDQSKLVTLRVLAVRKDKPYARPGDTVNLGILYDDGTLTDTDAGAKSKRPINVTWLAGCENPLGDVYALCYPQLAEAFSHGASSGTGQGPEFSFSLSSDIISRRPPPTDHTPPHGLAYVFFFVCAGTL